MKHKMMLVKYAIIFIIYLFNLINALIDQQPIFTSQPTDTGPLFRGARGILQCSASGTPPITYRWLKNSINITEPLTNGVYLISSVSKDDVAQYQCIASNPLGSVLSNKAQLSIACKLIYLNVSYFLFSFFFLFKIKILKNQHLPIKLIDECMLAKQLF
jgi:hypothetical protein